MKKKLFLCATGLTESSLNSLQWTFELAGKCEAQVAILFCYRLIPQDAEGGDNIDIKKTMEEGARNRFRQLEKNFIKKAVVPYQFYPEVGFFSTRIEAFVKRTQVNLLVVGSQVVQSFNENLNMNFEQFIKDLKVPVTIVPEDLEIPIAIG